MREVLTLSDRGLQELLEELIIKRQGMILLPVKGRSMWPFIREGDLVKIKPAKAHPIRIGDIAVCRKDSKIIIHRVMWKQKLNGEWRFLTKGDASLGFDKETGGADILGIVTAIERSGRILDTGKSFFRLGPFLWNGLSFFPLYLFFLVKKVKQLLIKA